MAVSPKGCRCFKQSEPSRADLFAQGLREADLSESLGTLMASPMLDSGAALVEDHAEIAQPSDVGDPHGAGENRAALWTEAMGPTLADVKWNPDDEEQPDFRHLPKLGPPGQSST